jgi:acyl dehydratase
MDALWLDTRDNCAAVDNDTQPVHLDEGAAAAPSTSSLRDLAPAGRRRVSDAILYKLVE